MHHPTHPADHNVARATSLAHNSRRSPVWLMLSSALGLLLVTLGPVMLLANPQHRSTNPDFHVVAGGPPAQDDAQKLFGEYQTKIKPLLSKYCTDCHGTDGPSAGIALEGLSKKVHVLKGRKNWLAAAETQRNKRMPPSDSDQPTAAERALLLQWFEKAGQTVDCGTLHPGPALIRRLNRAEYANTVRDLFGIEDDIAGAVGLPDDKQVGAFDTLAHGLAIPDSLMEKYVAAADKIIDRVIVPQYPVQTMSAKQLAVTLQGKAYLENRAPKNHPTHRLENNALTLLTQSKASGKFQVSQAGDYFIRITMWGLNQRRVYPGVQVLANDKPAKTFVIAADKKKPRTIETRVTLEKGTQEIGVMFTNPFYNNWQRKPELAFRELSLSQIQLVGPIKKQRVKVIPDQKANDRLIFVQPSDKRPARDAAKQIMSRFGLRAYRRPLTDAELNRFLTLYDYSAKKNQRFDQSIALMVKATLLSPYFLLRIEQNQRPDGSSEAYRVTDFELASRLSYFLWSSMPDDELFTLAQKKQLHHRDVLHKQVRRMLQDPKADAWVENFCGQWLRLRDFENARPSEEYFPKLTPAVRNGMYLETITFLKHVMRQDRPLLELIDCDYSFVTRALALHYRAPLVPNGPPKRITIPRRGRDQGRGGLLGMGSILVLTSHTSRTSPTMRGQYILDVMLGTPPPPPPADAGQIDEATEKKETLTFREKLALHAKQTSCAACHSKMDPLGFALENFTADGQFRYEIDGKRQMSTGTLPDGNVIKGPVELKKVLLDKKDQFIRNLVEKSLSYSLGRKLDYYDECTVREIMQHIKKDNYKFSSLILGVVESYPFQNRVNSNAPPLE